MRPQFSINQKRRIHALVGCCRRYRAMALGGSRARENSLFQGRALTMIRRTGGTLGVGFWSGLSKAPPKTQTTRMVIQTKETRNYRGACWTAARIAIFQAYA